MKTYEISKTEIKNMERLAVGYKAVKCDNGTQQHGFRYGEKGEDLVGKIFKVDGDIKECKWGLHFSKDPANVFNFYEPLGYNKYFKVYAYGVVVDSKDGLKTVAQIIEFVEEYDIMEYIRIIKSYDRAVSHSNAVSDSDAVVYSDAVIDSAAVSHSDAVSDSCAVDYSDAVVYSDAVSHSNAVRDSEAVSLSNAVSGSKAVSLSNAVSGSKAVSLSNAVRASEAVNFSNAVSDSNAVCCSNAVSRSNAVSSSHAVSFSYGLKSCEAIKNGIFCYKKVGAKNVIFNKKVTKERFTEVYNKILSFGYQPRWDNFYELKGNKEWYTIAFPELMSVNNKTAWSKMPTEMVEYIKSLPEYNEKVFKAITEGETNGR